MLHSRETESGRRWQAPFRCLKEGREQSLARFGFLGRREGSYARAIWRIAWWALLPVAIASIGTPLARAAKNSLVALGIVKRDRHPQRLLGLLQADLRIVRPGSVDDQFHPVEQAVKLLEQLHQPRRVPQTRQVELEDHQDHIGHLECDEVGRLEALAGVDEHRGERRLEQRSNRRRASGSILAASSMATGWGSTYSPELWRVSERFRSVRSRRSIFWMIPCNDWSGMMSRQASTDPKRRSKSARIASCGDDLARVVPRLTASEVQPTPPELR